MPAVIVSVVRAGHFLPNEGSFYCPSCPHSGACRAWHRDMARTSVRMAA